MNPGPLDAATLGVLLVGLPALSILQARTLGDVEIPRMPAYVSSTVSLLLLAALVAAVGWRHGGPAALGLVELPWPSFLSWTGALVMAGLVAVATFRWIGIRVGAGEEPLLRALLPRTPRERSAFAVLSGAAGLGEELAYRAYVIGVLTPFTGAVGAAVGSSVVFGVMHVYQGPIGMARTAVMGGILAAGFLLSGSLWPAVAAHALLDVLLGIVLGERMMVPRDPSGVSSR